MTYVITDACLDVMDRSCLTQCPVDCIQQGERMVYINPDECIDCGACEPACPQSAIFFDDELPADLSEYRKVNLEFFTGSPGTDHPLVAALPRRA